MALPSPLLIAVERLSQSENKLLRDYSSLHPPLVDIALVDFAVQQVVLDKLSFAQEFVASAWAILAGAPSTMDFRNATSRGYYAVHHSLRAVLLFDLKADSYGHAESIADFVKRMRSVPVLNTKAQAAAITGTALNDLLRNRHLADYHYYGAATPHEAAVDFSVVGPAAVKFADGVVVKLCEYVKDRIAGRY